MWHTCTCSMPARRATVAVPSPASLDSFQVRVTTARAKACLPVNLNGGGLREVGGVHACWMDGTGLFRHPPVCLSAVKDNGPVFLAGEYRGNCGELLSCRPCGRPLSPGLGGYTRGGGLAVVVALEAYPVESRRPLLAFA